MELDRLVRRSSSIVWFEGRRRLVRRFDAIWFDGETRLDRVRDAIWFGRLVRRDLPFEGQADQQLNLINSMLREAKWARDKSVPTRDAYMTNGLVSFASGPIVLPALFCWVWYSQRRLFAVLNSKSIQAYEQFWASSQ